MLFSDRVEERTNLQAGFSVSGGVARPVPAGTFPVAGDRGLRASDLFAQLSDLRPSVGRRLVVAVSGDDRELQMLLSIANIFVDRRQTLVRTRSLRV